MGYYRQVNDLDPDNREQFGKRDLVLAGYQIVRLEKKAQEEAERVFSSETALTELKSRMEGKIATLPAEKNPEVTTVAGKSELVLSEWAFLPDIDAWSDDEVLGELSEETVLVQQLKAKIHEVFDPMVAESLRAQFYADMQRMFQLCDKLNLMVSDELPFPLEMLPFDLANQIYWLNCDAKRRQMEKALAVEALVKFPA